MNDQLQELYRGVWMQLESLAERFDLSWPHLMKVPEGYHAAAVKVMVVGQTPYDWMVTDRRRLDLGSDEVKTLMTAYESFGLGTRYNRSPFWQAVHKIGDKANPKAAPKEQVLWSNLLKMDRRNARPSADAVDDLLRLRLLEREIEITRPDVVVFFTGDVKRAFRTYHPNFLRLRRQWHRVTEIGEAIAGMAQSASR